MHELAICQNLLAEVAKVAAAHRAAVVTRVFVAIGPLSGVEAPQLVRAFGVARTGTVAATAVLVVETPPVAVWCDNCERESAVAANALLCGMCGTWKIALKSGDELLLKRVELAEASDPAPIDARQVRGGCHVQ
ncbi:MAG: hydrogenase maturation nickel metallochaperone HypA [Silicimonas sp.]